MSDRMSASLNLLSFSAEPGVSVQQPVHGQNTSLSSPDGTDGCHRQFQGSEGGPMPRGSGFAHPSCIGESLARNVNLGAAEAPAQATPFGDAAHAQSRSFLLRRSVSFDNSTSPSSVHPEGELEDDDDRASIASVDAVCDKTFARLIAFVYDQYPESRSLSSPSLPPWCGFESLFAVSDPLSSFRPKLRLYPRVSEIVSDNRNRSAKLALESKPIHRVLRLKRRMFTVADEPNYSRPLLVNPDF